MTTPGDVLAKYDEWITQDGGLPEDPPGSNHNAITEAFADRSGWEWMRRGQPWCDAGASQALTECGLETTFASCLAHIAAFQSGEAGIWLGFDPDAAQPGDFLFYGPRGGSHVEILVAKGATGCFTRGCNVRDAVRYQWRSYRGTGNFDVYGFGRPHYDGQVVNFPPPPPHDPAAPPAPALASIAMPAISRATRKSNDKRAVRIHQAIVGVSPDGDFGPATDAATRAWQRFFGLAVDGAVGDQTWTISLQYELHKAGGTQVVIDGQIGPTTTAVLLYYQGASGLTPDGIAGPDTFGSLTGQ